MGKLLSKIRRVLSGKSKEQSEMEYLKANGLKIGRNSVVYSGFAFDSNWPWLISIGDNVVVSSNVTILAHDASSNVVKCGTKLGRVSIGNNVFIGARSTILCNVRIGNNVVVGAGSLVTHDLPGNGVYAGVPAVKICSIEEYEAKCRQLRQTRPNFKTIHRWDEWKTATDEEKQAMIDRLDDGLGFV